MIFDSQAKRDGRQAVGLLAAKITVLELLVSSIAGSSLAAMSPEGAADVKNEIGARLKAVRAGLHDAEFAASYDAAVAQATALIDASEADIRHRATGATPPA
jgi:hypothetical protein